MRKTITAAAVTALAALAALAALSLTACSGAGTGHSAVKAAAGSAGARAEAWAAHELDIAMKNGASKADTEALLKFAFGIVSLDADSAKDQSGVVRADATVKDLSHEAVGVFGLGEPKFYTAY